jgi:hypothetical protein
MRVIYLIPLLFLSGCSATSQVVTTTRYQVVTPDPSMYKCESVRYPDYKNLTDSQIAKLLTDLHKKNSECRNSIQSIQKFLDEAKKTVESNV